MPNQANVSSSPSGAPLASPSGPPSPSPTSSPIVSPSPSATASVVLLEDPVITGILPAGWKRVALADFRAQLVLLRASVPKAVRGEIDEQISQLDRGELRLMVEGHSGGSLDVIRLSVKTDSRTLDEIAKATIAHARKLAPGVTLVGTIREQVDLGPLIRLEFVSGPVTSGSRSRTLYYLVRLDHRRTLTVVASGLMSDDAFPRLADSFARGLSLASQ